MAAKLVKLIVDGATQQNVTGAKNWAAVKNAGGLVTAEATTSPRNSVDEWKQLVWGGDKGEAGNQANVASCRLRRAKSCTST